MVLEYIQNQLYEGVEVQFWDSRLDKAIPLTGYTTGFFTMVDRKTLTNKVHAAVTPVDLADGKVKYVFVGTDLDTIGNFKGQFTINGLGAGPLKLFTPEIVVATELATS